MAARQVGSVFIRVRPDTRDFRRDTDQEVRRELAGYQAEVPVTPDLDQSELRRERNRAQNYLDRNELELEVDLDFERRLRGMEDSFRRMSDAVANTQRSVIELQRNMRDIGEAKVGVSREDFDKLMDDVNDMRVELSMSTGDARRSWEAMKAEVEATGIETSLEASPNRSSAIAASAQMQAAAPDVRVGVRLTLARAMAQLAALQTLGNATRISVDVVPRIANRSWINLERRLLAMSQRRVARMADRSFDRVWRTWAVGGFRSMAGMGDMDEMLHAFDNIISRMDVLSSKAAIMGTAIGSAVNVAGHALGGLLVTVGDITRGFGLLAAAPSALLAAWAGFHTHRSIWQDFGAALEGDTDALERIPENGQRAVAAIDELSQAVNRSIQDGFWGVMTDEIERFTEVVGPQLERGMTRTAEVYGETMSSMLNLAERWARTGDLAQGFSNINRMFEGVGGGVVELFDAFVTVGLRAARMMPRLGHEFEQLGGSINSYMQWAAEMGMLEYWIESGVNVVHQLVRAGGALGGTFRGLAGAARRAGIVGLPALVAGLERASELMQGPIFQYRMGNIFEGMAVGAREVWTGVERISTAFYDAHEWANRLFTSMGTAGGEALARIADVISNVTFQEGMIDLFDGFTDMLSFLEVGADYFGDILGGLGAIGGEILRETAPGIETLLGIFSDLSNSLVPMIVDLVDPLTNFIDNLGHTVRYNVNNFIVPALSALGNAFLGLHPLIQNALMLMMATARWLPAFGNAWARIMKGVGTTLGTSAAVRASHANQERGLSGMLARIDERYARTRTSALKLTEAQKAQRTAFQRSAQTLSGGLGIMARATEQYGRMGSQIGRINAPMANAAQQMSNFRTASQDTARIAGNGFRVLGDQAAIGARRVATSMAGMVTSTSRLLRDTESVQRAMGNLQRTGGMTTNYMGGATIFRDTRAQVNDLERDIRNLRRVSDNAFRGLGASIGAQFTAAAGMIRSAMLPAIGAVSTAARGLAGVFRGMWSLVGGLPGVVLIGAISALGHFRGQTAEARREVESLRQAMDQRDPFVMMDEIAQMDGMSRALSKLEDAGISATYVLGELALGNDISGILDQVDAIGWLSDEIDFLVNGTDPHGAIDTLGNFIQFGESADYAAERLELMNDAYQRLTGETLQEAFDIGGFERIQEAVEGIDGLEHIGPVLDEVQDKFAEASAMADLHAAALQHVAREAARTGDWRSLHNALLDYGEGFHEASAEAEHFASAIGRVGEQGATVDARIQGMSQAMRILRDDWSEFGGTGYEAWNRQEEAIRTATEAALSNSEVNGKLIDDSGRLASSAADYEQGQERLHLAHQAVNESLEGQIALGLEAYDKAIANGEGHQRAVELASIAYQDMDGQVQGVIEAMTGLSDESTNFMEILGSGDESRIQAFVDEFGDAGVAAAALYGEFEALSDYSAFEMSLMLSVLGEDEVAAALDGLERLQLAGYEISGTEWAAFVTANPDQAFTALYHTQLAFENWEAYEFVTSLGANADTALGIIAESIGMGDQYARGDYSAILMAIADGAHVDIEGAIDLLVQYSELNPEAELLTRDEASEVVHGLMGELDGLDEGTWTAHLEGEGFTAIEEGLGEIVDVLKEIGENLWPVNFDTNADEVSSDMEGVKELADGLNLLNPSINIESNAPDVEVEVQGAAGSVKSIDGTVSTARIDVEDEATPTTGGAIHTLGMFNGAYALAHIDADDDASPKANGARTVLGLIPRTITTLLTGNGNLEGRASDARDAVDSIPNSASSLLSAADYLSAPAGDARDAVESIPNTRTSTLSVASHMIYIRFANAAKRAAESIPRTWITRLGIPTARMFSGQANSARSAVMSIPRTWTTSIRAYSNVPGVAAAARRALATIPRSRTVTVHTRRTSSTANADGNILTGAARAFASGGIAEKHVAQIAQPMTPYRIWAEPETGGEAYIPLAASKRARSLQIWEETGRRLGAYADGGVNGGGAVDSGGRGPTFNFHTYNPQAEPNSKTAQRTAEFIGMGGGDWE